MPRQRRIVRLRATPDQSFEIVSCGSRRTLAVGKAHAGDQVWIVSERQSPLYGIDSRERRTFQLLMKLGRPSEKA